MEEQGRCWTETTRATKVADNERQMEGEKNEEKEHGTEKRGDERQMDLCDGWRGGRMK